ncbi:hypothetical protein KPL40_15895 [Clostridium gasigenes]|uniref:hypothetical protein n=1 Tax=Clostridium gasigenes TaxID=94869 RepID=UPI001C0BEF4B|nr:hypothetical protein [Clostridium gasigenes]MBU3133912.1 hypothetical protein [Clostridium gasigenes]
MNEIVEKFKISLIEDGKSPKKIESYIRDAKTLIDFMSDKGLNSIVIYKYFK